MKVTSFGSYDIPQSLGQFFFNPTQVDPVSTIMAASGVFDNLGEAIILRQGIIKVSFAIYGQNWNEVDTQIDEAKRAFSLSKGRDLLKLTFGDDVVATRQALARCLSFKMPFSFDDCHLVRCDAEFEIIPSSFDAIAVSNFSSNLVEFDIDNSASTGTIQRSLIIRINGIYPAGDITLTNETNGLSFVFDASANPLPGPGNFIDIDCGSLTVVNSIGNDKYEFLTIGNNQVGFMKLEPSLNSFTLLPALNGNVDFTWRNAYI